MINQLERRIRYFLNSRLRGREDVRETLHDIRHFGRVVLIGGMLRDIALFGNAGFRSDLDMVIDPYDLPSFDKYMSDAGACRNRFGGYALPFKKWQIDIWPLQRTWAHREGYIRVNSIGDLKKVTFFSCDAIIYDLSRKHLRAKAGYFDNLNHKRLEINLRPNPNPRGNAVRAIRYSLLKGFRWGPSVSEFMAESIDYFGWRSLIEYEKLSFRTNYIETLDLEDLGCKLKECSFDNRSEVFDPREFLKTAQLKLPFNEQR